MRKESYWIDTSIIYLTFSASLQTVVQYYFDGYVINIVLALNETSTNNMFGHFIYFLCMFVCVCTCAFNTHKLLSLQKNTELNFIIYKQWLCKKKWIQWHIDLTIFSRHLLLISQTIRFNTTIWNISQFTRHILIIYLKSRW
jgi:hypothetical protein